jgi:hypothetical protein
MIPTGHNLRKGVCCTIPAELFVQQDLSWAVMNDLSLERFHPSTCSALFTYVGKQGREGESE